MYICLNLHVPIWREIPCFKREDTFKLYVFIVNQELRSLTINHQQVCIQVIKISLKDMDSFIELCQ